MKLDIATTALLAQFASADGPPMYEMSAEEARLVGEGMAGAYPDGPEMAETRDIEIPASDGGKIRARIHRPVDAPKGVLIYYHGGGWVLSNIDQYDCVGRQLAERTACTVLLVDYRKAPEFKYPTAPNDAWDALNWAADNRDQLGGKDLPIMVGGDSAGGNLTIVTTNALVNDPADVPVLVQAPIYPVASDISKHESLRQFSEGYLLTGPTMAWFTKQYGGDPSDPRTTPIFGDCANTPPSVICTAGLDPLRDSGREYAAHLIQQGTEVAYFEFSGIIHGFTTLRKAIPSGQKDVDAFLGAIRIKLDRIAA